MGMEIGRLWVQGYATWPIAAPFRTMTDCAVLAVEGLTGGDGLLCDRNGVRQGRSLFRDSVLMAFVVITLGMVGLTVLVSP